MDKNKGFSISRYAFLSFRHYGGKSIVFMIALAVTLVLALFNLSTSLQRTMIEQAIDIGGDAHFGYSGVTAEQIKTVKAQAEVEWALESVCLGNIGSNFNGCGIGLNYIENPGIMDGFKITSGKPPEKENEVAMAPHVAELLGIEAKPGTEFELEIFDFDESGIPAAKKFIISGVLQRQRSFEAYEAYIIFVSREFMLANADFENKDSRQLYVKLKSGHDAYIVAEKIAKTAGIDDKNISFNYSYLRAALNGFETSLVFYIIIAFFALVGALIIYNAFNIVIAKRTRHFGLLTLIGASKRQIRRCVYTEALLNTAAALPFGLISGTFLSWIVMPLIQDGFAGMGALSVSFYITHWSYLLTVLITIIMVFAGALIPARRAQKITPVEAAKFVTGSPKISKKPNKIKILKNINLKSLARINLFRKKGGAIGTVASLSIVGMLFIALSLIFFSVFNSIEFLIRDNMAADIQIMQGIKTGGGITYSGGGKPVLPERVVNEIINLDGVKSPHVFYEQTYRDSNPPADGYFEQGYIIAVDDEVMEKLLEIVSEPPERLGLSDFENPANVISTQFFRQFDNFNTFVYNFDNFVGSEKTVNLQKITDEAPTGQATLYIAGLIDPWKIPQYLDFYIGGLPMMFMPVSSFEANPYLTMSVYGIALNIDDANYDGIIAALDKICGEEGNIHYRSFIELKREMQSQVMSIIILIMAGLGIVFMVSVLNLISTTFIGIEQRKKELGVLSALGLGRRELKIMLKWEGIWVSVFSTVLSVAGGCFFGYLFYLWIESMGGDYIRLSFPVVPAVVFCLIYIFAPYIITSVAVRRLLKNTTVELIGQEI